MKTLKVSYKTTKLWLKFNLLYIEFTTNTIAPNTSYNPITNPLPSLNQNPYIHTPGKSLKNQRLYKASNIDKMMHERYRNLSVGSLQPRLSYS